MPKNYRKTIEYLYEQLPVFHRIGAAAYKPDIGNITALCNLLGQPHKKLTSIHIAGTNGKGSVSHMLASILQSAGYKTGLHTSPHLKDYRERFRINGKMISKSEVVRFINTWKNDFSAIKPSFFEISVALAFDYFAKKQVDIAIIETGMGGRLDSTNIITPVASVITNIGWDHMTFLGDTLEKIAAEKAGIIKPGIPVIIGETKTETKKVFLEKAYSGKSPVYFATESFRVEKAGKKAITGSYYNVFQGDDLIYENLFCPLGGDYQIQNILTVIQSVEVIKNKGYSIREEHIRQGLADVVRLTGLKGRWQILSRKPLTIADVGHNKNGFEFILKQISSTPHQHLHFVIGMVNDKEIDSVLGMLPKQAVYYFCKPNIPRGLDADILREKALVAGLKGQTYLSVSEAYAAAREKALINDLIFIGGSTFVVAEVV